MVKRKDGKPPRRANVLGSWKDGTPTVHTTAYIEQRRERQLALEQRDALDALAKLLPSQRGGQ